MMKSLIVSALALAALCATGAAQQQRGAPISIQGQPRHATIDMASGTLTRDAQDKAATLVTTWANTDYSGWTSVAFVPGEEWLQWGTLSNTSGSDIVGAYQFGYATSILDTSVGGNGASLCTSFYNGATGWCAESGLGLNPDYELCWSGLPGTGTSGVFAGWIVTVTLTGGFEFQMPAGPFGMTIDLFDLQTGPLLCYAGTPAGTGYDANGQEDAFDGYTPDINSGTCITYWFGGIPYNISSWWLYIQQAVNDGVNDQASCTFYCGSGVNVGGFNVSANAQLGGTFVHTVTHGRAFNLLYAYASPLQFPYNGQEILINFVDPAGMLLGAPAAGVSGVPIALPVPINLFLCGFHFFCQAVSVGGGIDLHCAYDCAIGF